MGLWSVNRSPVMPLGLKVPGEAWNRASMDESREALNQVRQFSSQLSSAMAKPQSPSCSFISS